MFTNFRAIWAPAKTEKHDSLASTSKALIMHRASIDKAIQLRDSIKPWMNLPELNLPSFEDVDRAMQDLWLQYCVPYVSCLMVAAQLKKDAAFAQTDDFKVLYGQSVLFMVELDKQNLNGMEFHEKFNHRQSEQLAIKEMGEVEDALLYYIDATINKTPVPESRLLAYLIKKIGVPETARGEFILNLQRFTFETMVEFSGV